MARGWEPGGSWEHDDSTHRLFCGSAGGAGGSGLGTMGVGGAAGGVGGGAGSSSTIVGGLTKPNAFLGQVLADDSPPEITLGPGPFSIEFWARWKGEYFPGPPCFNFCTGFWEWYIPSGVMEPKGGIATSGIGPDIYPYYDDVAGPPGPLAIAPITLPGGWHHIVLNYDRAANLSVYFDATYMANVAINNNDAGTCRFYAQAAIRDLYTWYDGNWNDWSTFHQARLLIGPIAAHDRLLVVATDMVDSWLRKSVQNFGPGAGNTFLHWDWRYLERLDQEPITWETDETLTFHAFRAGVDGKGMVMPVGAPGTIRVPDLSGSGNHWVIPTLETYVRDATFLNLSPTAFMYDPSIWSF